MSGQWQYQLRIDVAEEHAERLRSQPGDPALAPLTAILSRHDAKAVCQYDAFAGYCAEAEREGIEEYPLYAWTKATIENPAKNVADTIEAELNPLVGGGVVDRLHKYDTNPANNPQPPARYRM